MRVGSADARGAVSGAGLPVLALAVGGDVMDDEQAAEIVGMDLSIYDAE